MLACDETRLLHTRRGYCTSGVVSGDVNHVLADFTETRLSHLTQTLLFALAVLNLVGPL